MKVNKEGIHFNFKGYTITYHWPLLQIYFDQSRFLITGRGFAGANAESNSIVECIRRINNTIEYLHIKGEQLSVSHPSPTKVEGMYWHDLSEIYGMNKFIDSCGIVLEDIDVSAKSSEFWKNVPDNYKKQFMKDIVIINCSSPEEVKRLMFSLPADFCLAKGYCFGNKISENT